METMIWTGIWADAVQFMDRVGYSHTIFEHPALRLCEPPVIGEPLGKLHVDNNFLMIEDHADIGDTVIWYPSSRTFSVRPAALVTA